MGMKMKYVRITTMLIVIAIEFQIRARRVLQISGPVGLSKFSTKLALYEKKSAARTEVVV